MIKIGLPSALTILFVVLKVLDLISWSWAVVFVPLMVSAFLFLVSLILGLIVVLIGGKTLEYWSDNL